MRKVYMQPEWEVINVMEEDVITASGVKEITYVEGGFSSWDTCEAENWW